MILRHRTQFFEPGISFLDPAGRAKCPMIACAESMTRLHVIMKKAPVIDNAGDQFDLLLAGGWQHQRTRPRLERVKNDHRPVEQWTKTFETKDQVESEPVCGARGDP